MSRATFRERLRYRFDNTMSKGAPALIGCWRSSRRCCRRVRVIGLPWPTDASRRGLGHRQDAVDGPAATHGPRHGRRRRGVGVLDLPDVRGHDRRHLHRRRARRCASPPGWKPSWTTCARAARRWWSTGTPSCWAGRSSCSRSSPSSPRRRRASAGRVVAILADRDKVEMEDEIRARLGSLGRLRVVCRTGSPTEPADLELVNPQAAASVLVLSPRRWTTRTPA